MTNDATRVKAEGLSATRRTALAMTGAGLAAALTGVSAHAAKPPKVEQPSPKMQAAHKALTDACAELAAAREARDWLADEWRHRWPSLPEGIAWRGVVSDTDRVTDIVGRPICDPKTGDALSFRSLKSLKEFASREPRFTPKMQPAKRARLIAFHQQERAIYAAAVAFHAETGRLRELSGANAAVARVKRARQAVDAAMSSIMGVAVANLADLQIKAATVLLDAEVSGISNRLFDSSPVFGAPLLARDILALLEG